MTLGRRLATQLALLLACLVLTAVLGFEGVRGLRQDFSVALANYERLEQLYTVGTYVQASRSQLASELPNVRRAQQYSLLAEAELKRIAPTLPISEEERVSLVRSVENLARSFRAGQGTIDYTTPQTRLRQVVQQLRDQIVTAQRQAEERKQSTLWWLGAVAGSAILASIALGVKQWSAVMGPLHSMREGMKRIAGGRFDKQITLVRGSDREFIELARDFNQMARQLDTIYGQLQKRVESATRSAVQSERLAGIGMLAAGVAHEINNPLAIITGHIELQLARPLDENVRGALKIALDEAFRCKQIIDRLLSLSRGPSGQRELTRLDELAAEVARNVRFIAGAEGRAIEIVQCDEVEARVDAGEIKQVILNLLINAIKATPEGGRIEISVCRSGAWGEIVVSDDGMGMDRTVLERLFEPFFSARPGDQRGTGLGLTITKHIVEAHGGAIDADSDGPGRGSRFTVRLPVAMAGQPERQEAPVGA